METRSTFSRIKGTLSDIAPYVFTKKNFARFGYAVTLTLAGMGLEIAAPLAAAETISLMLASYTAGTAATTTILGVSLGPYAMVGTSIGAYVLKDVVSSYRTEVLAPVAPQAAKDLFSQYGVRSVARGQEEQRNANTQDDIVRSQKGFQAMYSITGQLFTTVIPVSFGAIINSALIGAKFGISTGAGLGGIVVLCTAYNISTTKRNMELRNKSLIAGNASYDAFMRQLEYTGTIQKNTTEEYELKRGDAAHQGWADAETESNVHSIQVARRENLITNAGYLGLAFLTARGVMTQSLRGEDYAALAAFLPPFLSNVNAFGASASGIVSGLADLESIFEHIKKRPKVKDDFPNREIRIAGSSASIELRNVNLSFDNHQILFNVTCTIPAGKKTVIVGGSGSGKSTLLNLIDRSIDPDSGVVLIDGQNIKEYGLKKVRAHISTIQQKTDLFHESIGENIKYGKPDSTDAEMVDAAKRASLHEWIEEQPKKYKMDVGERGSKLSGGQAQRVAIARALLRKPKILLCDEATSALDNATEAKIQEEIDSIPGITKVMVTHDLSAAVNADKIIVLEKGHVVEEGTHAELLAKNGAYAKLWNISNPAPVADKSVKDEKHAPAPLSAIPAAAAASASVKPVSNDKHHPAAPLPAAAAGPTPANEKAKVVNSLVASGPTLFGGKMISAGATAAGSSSTPPAAEAAAASKPVTAAAAPSATQPPQVAIEISAAPTVAPINAAANAHVVTDGAEDDTTPTNRYCYGGGSGGCGIM